LSRQARFEFTDVDYRRKKTRKEITTETQREKENYEQQNTEIENLKKDTSE